MNLLRSKKVKQIIKDVLNDMKDSQINLGSEMARETIAGLVSVALKDKGTYTEYGDSELAEQRTRETWVCEICGKSTYDVDYDYVGSGTNHLGCELQIEMDNAAGINPNDDTDHYTGPESIQWIYESPDGDIVYRRKEGETKRQLGYKHPDTGPPYTMMDMTGQTEWIDEDKAKKRHWYDEYVGKK